MGLIATLERRGKSTSVDDPRWTRLFGGARSAAGIDVTPDRALGVTAVWAAVNIIAGTVATLPAKLYRRDGGTRTVARDHPVHGLLSREPNDWQTPAEWKEMMQGHLLLRGNAFSRVARTRGGRPAALVPLHPDRITVEVSGGRIVYRYQPPGGPEERLDAGEMLHLRGLSSNGLMGHSPVTLMREAVGLAMATERHAARFFSNDARPGGVLQHPGNLSEEAASRLKRSWTEAHSGDRAHSVAVLESGLEWKSVGMSAQDAQFIDQRKLQIAEVARVFNVPPHLLKDLDRATFCLPGDAEVFTVEGPKPIKEVKAGEAVWSLDQSAGWVRSTVKRSACTGYDSILKIRTTNRTIRLNARHKVLARRRVVAPIPAAVHPGGVAEEHGHARRARWVTRYVPAAELSEGDTIVSLDRLPDRGTDRTPTRRATVPFMEFVGYYLGNGWTTSDVRPTGERVPRTVGIAHPDGQDWIEHYRGILPTLFHKCRPGGRGPASSRQMVPVHIQRRRNATRFGSVTAAAEIGELGLSGTARTKQLPGWVFELSEELRLACLRGYLDADGHACAKGRLAFHSASRPLASGMRHLCMSVGIPVTNLRCQKGRTTLPTGKQTDFESWSFTCSDPGSNRRIGSHCPEYEKRMAAGKPFARKDRRYPRHGGRGFALAGCKLSRIARIEREGVEQPVYDLEVAETHSFVADGVVVHNSNIEHMGIEFHVHTIRPWLVRWEEALARALLDAGERSDHFVKFNADAILRGDNASRSQHYREMFGIGAYSINDIRELEDLNPVESGDDRFVPLNMVPLGRADEPLFERPPSRRAVAPAEARARTEHRSIRERRRIKARYRRLMEEAAGRVVRREVGRVRSLVRKHLGERGAPTARSALSLREAIERFYGEHETYSRDALRPVVFALAEAIHASVADELAADAALPPEVERFVEDYMRDLGPRVGGNGRGALLGLINDTEPAELAAAILAELDGWDEERAERIAAEETDREAGALAMTAYAALGVVYLRSVAFGADPCPMCLEIQDRGPVRTGEPFVGAGEKIDGGDHGFLQPSTPLRHPPHHAGCQCELVPG